MNLNNKNLIIFSENYPYEGGEQFFVNDLFYLSTHFSKVYVFPTIDNGKDFFSKCPSNLTLLQVIDKESNKRNVLSNFRLYFSMLFCEIILNKNRFYFIKNLKYFLSLFSEAIEMEKVFNNQINELGIQKDDAFHSLWMNKYTLMLSISKFKKNITDFTFRINGYDIFEERNKGGYIPFERFNYWQAKKIIINSKFAFAYKSKQQLYKHKLDYNYYSIDDYGMNPTSESTTFHIVSCSNIIPLKRVHLISEAIQNSSIKIKWTHFGDGSERKNIEEIIFSENVEVSFKGKVSNKEINDFYRVIPINLFLHVSESEGLGYAIIEALNFGIPCIACNAGGVGDLVSEENGKLLPIQISPKLIYQEILNFSSSFKNTPEFKEKVKKDFDNKFNKNKLVENLVNSVS